MKKVTNLFLAVVALLCCYSQRINAQALHFGAYSHIHIGDVLPNGQSYTKEAWIRIFNYGYEDGRSVNILSAWDFPFWLQQGVLSASNGYFTSDAEGPTVKDNTALSLNTWTHVAVTYDAATTTMKLYKNGTLISTNTQAPSYIASDLQIGAQDYSNFFDGGDMDEVRIWNVARSQSQIQGAMNTDVAQNTNLIAYYRFDQGTPGGDNSVLTSVYDYSGNANCGSMEIFDLTGTGSNYIAGKVTATNYIAVVTSAPGTIGGSSSVCEGATITLTNSVSGGVWSVNDIDTAEVSEAGILTGNFGGSVTVSYKTCGGVATKNITVNPTPIVSATASNGSIVASAEEGTPSYSYKWSTGSTSATLSGLATGTYTVTVTDAKGCKDANSYYVTGSVILTNMIQIAPDGNVYTGGDKHIIYLGYGAQTAKLIAKPTGSSSFTYSWYPTTYLSSSTSKNPTFSPTKAGTYTYTCTATSNGNSVKATVTMIVIDANDYKHKGCVFVSHYSKCNKGKGDTKSMKCKEVAKQLKNNHSDRLGACGSNKQSRPDDIKGMIIVPNELVVSTFPNPFTDGISVSVEGNEAETADVTVYDLSGRMMESKQNQQVNGAIVVGNNLAGGMYILEVKKGEQSKILKVVKAN